MPRWRRPGSTIRRSVRSSATTVRSALQGEDEFITKISQSERDVVLVIVLREPEQAIGLTGLHQIDPKDRHAQFGITIGVKEHWGKGYGTEATRLIVRYTFHTL